MLIEISNESLPIAFCPQELLEVHRVHLVVLFVAHAIRLYLLIVDTHERARSNHVEATIQLEKLQRGGTSRTGLQLIKKEERLTGNKPQQRIQQRDVFEQRVHLVSIIENTLEFRLLHKIDSDHLPIVCLGKSRNGGCLANLPSPFYDQWFMIRTLFPCSKHAIYLSPKKFTHNHHRIYRQK